MEYIGPHSKRSAFSSRDTHPLVLDVLMLEAFGREYLEWEPETCWIEVNRQFNTTISEVSRNKIQATRTCHLRTTPYEQWEVFEKVAIALSGRTPRFDLMQKPNGYNCAFALSVMEKINPKELSTEVVKYICAVLMDEGCSFGPGGLAVCNTYLNKHTKGVTSTVRKLYEKGATPLFDGTNKHDVQLAKAYSIRDYTDMMNRILLLQLKKLVESK